VGNLFCSPDTPERLFVGYFSLSCSNHLPFSKVQNNTFNVEGHDTTEMIPVLLNDGCKSRLTCPMILMRYPKILFNLVPDFGYILVSLNLRFRKSSIDLVLSHDAITDSIHIYFFILPPTLEQQDLCKAGFNIDELTAIRVQKKLLFAERL